MGMAGWDRGPRTAVPSAVLPFRHPRSAMKTSRDPLHGITLETIVKQLVARFGWAEMAYHIPIRCFQNNPSVKSSLTFLRKTPWARQKVEAWFIEERLNE